MSSLPKIRGGDLTNPVVSAVEAFVPPRQGRHGKSGKSSVSDHSRWRGASLGLPSGDSADLIRQVEKGIPFDALATLASSSGLAIHELTDLLQIPARTLARRRQVGRFDLAESERLLSLALVFEKALSLFDGNVEEAVEWLRQPKKALAGETPLKYARTAIGAREVENLIGRIEHGVFS